MFLMVCEFDDLRMWLQCLEKQSRGRDRLNEEVRMRKMELESRSMTNDGKAKVVVKLGVYGNDVKKLKNELAKLRSCSAIQAMGYSDQWGRLVTSFDNVHGEYNANRSKKTSSDGAHPGAIYASQTLQFRLSVYVEEEITGEFKALSIREMKKQYM
ncbi:vesicle transport v-SNARE 11 [Tanacetum coccineum]